MYLDYNATTPMAPEVVDAISHAMNNAWANPSSSHPPGLAAKAVIDKARSSIAQMLAADPEDVVFTSGGTESNMMVLQTVVKHFRGQLPTGQLPHIITSNLEHDSIRIPLQKFLEEGLAEVTFVSASTSSGHVEVDQVIAAVKPNTCLVSIMMANNETGVIQPVQDICRTVKHLAKGILVHTDAAQAIGKVITNVQHLGVDYLTIVGHKFYGPRIGAVYVRKPGDQTPLLPIFYGGGQERNFRSGTENTAMIAGLGMAAQLVVENLQMYEENMRTQRDFMQLAFLEECADKDAKMEVSINGKYECSERLPNTLNFSFIGEGLTGQSVLSQVPGLQAGVGAACHSSSVAKASPVLIASGVPECIARNAIRLSFGREQLSKEELRQMAHQLTTAAHSLCHTQQ